MCTACMVEAGVPGTQGQPRLHKASQDYVFLLSANKHKR